jgi:hypothetical protein
VGVKRERARVVADRRLSSSVVATGGVSAVAVVAVNRRDAGVLDVGGVGPVRQLIDRDAHSAESSRDDGGGLAAAGRVWLLQVAPLMT